MDIDELEKSFEVQILKDEIAKKDSEIRRLTEIIKDNGLDEELDQVTLMTPEEEICVKGIEQILELVRNKCFDKTDIANFDILNKNLRMIRGHQDDKRKVKPSKVEDLLKIVQGDKK